MRLPRRKENSMRRKGSTTWTYVGVAKQTHDIGIRGCLSELANRTLSVNWLWHISKIKMAQLNPLEKKLLLVRSRYSLLDLSFDEKHISLCQRFDIYYPWA